jgi:FtsZ-interacting cell division protein ZipA
MKYQEALKAKGLGIENLPKSLQKKIKDLDFQIDTLTEIEKTPEEELGDSELADIEIIKSNISELDSHIAHKVKIFDQAKYEDKLAKISMMTKAKNEAKGGIVKQDEPIKQEIDVKGPEFATQAPPADKVVPISQEPTPQPQPVYEQPQYEPEPIHEDYPSTESQEEEEFERKGTGKPKKMTTGIILMGVGAFFLTWGAVNFFKSRK